MPPVLLIVVAHPDDETFGTGSVIAHSAKVGARVVVCCATRGELGEDVSGATSSPAELAEVREMELRAAAATLGADEVVLLDFADSGMTGDIPANALVAASEDTVAERVADIIERVRPDVVVTMRPDTRDDHRDHKRIGAATTRAFERAARPGARLYYWCIPDTLFKPWLAELIEQGSLPAYADLEIGTPDAMITTIVDVAQVADIRRAGIAEHRTQFAPFTGVSEALYDQILAHDHFVRVVPPWDGAATETSLFDDR